jgi:hypothetical protein
MKPSSIEVKLNVVLDVLDRLEQKVDHIEERLRCSEVAGARFTAELEALSVKESQTLARLEKAEAMVFGMPNKSALQQLEERVARLEPPVKVFLWVGSIIGAAVLALLWALMTQQAVLSFP